MTETEIAETDRQPGCDGDCKQRRPPFGGKRCLLNVVPVRFERSFISEIYNSGELFLTEGEAVVVDTSKGPALGTVCGLVRRRVFEKGRIRRIIRRASDDDVKRHQDNRLLARDALNLGLRRIKARRLKMKLCQVEYMLDRSRFLFYFSADQRIDFRQLVRDLSQQLDSRIEMRQIGVRDGAGLIGGLGLCGRELCCCSFLKSFRSISIRHAKDQGLTLNPKKVSGMCGRLMCCLVYEHEAYRRAKAGAPRVNRAVETEHGPGVVTEVDLLRRLVRVYIAGSGNEVFNYRDVAVDNSTIRRVRDLAKLAPQSRPKRETRVTRAGSNLQEEYQWDDAEAEDNLLDGGPGNEAESPKRTKKKRRRRRRKPHAEQKNQQRARSSAQPSSASDASKNNDQKAKPAGRKRRRRRRGRRRGPKKPSTDSKPSSDS